MRQVTGVPASDAITVMAPASTLSSEIHPPGSSVNEPWGVQGRGGAAEADCHIRRLALVLDADLLQGVVCRHQGLEQRRLWSRG